MIRFLLKGLLRDRSRSFFPLLIVMGGVSCTVVLYSYLTGVENEMVMAHASYNCGHVKIMSKAYAEEYDQIPNDLALMNVDTLLTILKTNFPKMIWTSRIKFGGMLDIPDGQGETLIQSPVFGVAADLFSPQSPEQSILNLQDVLVQGRLPKQKGEIVISETLAQKLNVKPGETATFISTTMYGSLTATNFIISGTLHFGMAFMDHSTVIADLGDMQSVLDMENSAGEILGFSSSLIYQDGWPDQIASQFNERYSSEDEFAPVMLTLCDQEGNGEILDIAHFVSRIIILIFLIIMSIVLWNAGLMGSLRRYGEMGVRLAIGENKGHLYRSLLAESLVIGFVGSILGTVLGILFSYYLQVKGIDISSMTKNASVLIVDVLRAQVTPRSYIVGFVPGFVATFLGTTISGIGIYKRDTSQLFQELEA